jgi:hypothetical protein
MRRPMSRAAKGGSVMGVHPSRGRRGRSQRPIAASCR